MPTTYIVKHICCSYCGGRYKFDVRGGENNSKYSQKYSAVEEHEKTCLSNPENKSCFSCKYKIRNEYDSNSIDGSPTVVYSCLVSSPRSSNLITKDNRLLSVATKCEDWRA